jgi:hypothetical protein
MKTIKPWKQKLEQTLEDAKTAHVHGSAELILENGHITESDLQI